MVSIITITCQCAFKHDFKMMGPRATLPYTDGFMTDTMYGPYQAANVLATSCWKPRDYSSGSATGCGDGARSCQLIDPYDYTKGTVQVL